MGEQSPDQGRRSFVSVALAGVSASVVAAVASGQPWMRIADPLAYDEAMPGAALAGLGTIGEVPLARAVSLVLVACWGVMLVTRGLLRRAMAFLAVLASATLAGSLIWAARNLPDQVRAAAQARVTVSESVANQDPSWTWWVLLSAMAAAVVLVASALAVLRVHRWPEMGRRYDSPGTPAVGADNPGELEDPAQWWKAIGEGRDPTT